MDDMTQPAPRPAYGAWATIGLGLVCGVVLAVTQIIAIVVVLLARYDREDLTDVSYLTEAIPRDGAILGVSVIAGAVVGIALILLIIKGRRGPSVAEYLALVPLSRRALGLTLAVGTGLYVASDALTLLLGKSVVPDFMVEAYKTRAWTVVMWTGMVVAGPAVEEVFFRGFLFTGLCRSRLGNAGTIVLTALVWSLMHTQYGFYEIATIFVLGIAYGVMRVKTGSLWSPLIMHMLGNLAATIEVAVYVGKGMG